MSYKKKKDFKEISLMKLKVSTLINPARIGS